MSRYIPGLGKINSLEIKRIITHGAFLQVEDEEVLLPRKFTPDSAKEGDFINVFLYTDSEDRPVATTQVPKGELGSIVALTVVDLTNFGAFLDWGLDKHLFVPNSEMEADMKVGMVYPVKIVLDHRTNRLIGVNKLRPFLTPAENIAQGDKVESLIINQTPLGYKAVVNGKHEGLIYKNETFQTVNIGDSIITYVQQVRDDGKLDLRLSPTGMDGLSITKKKVVEYLRHHQGESQLNDKSPPELIKSTLQMSKKAFKRAIGSLYKEKRIDLEDNKIRLLD